MTMSQEEFAKEAVLIETIVKLRDYRIHSIKLYRMLTNCTLKEARDAVNLIIRTHDVYKF